MFDPNEGTVELITGLNPDSADEMGYEWWKDTIYDLEAPEEAMQDIIDLSDEGYAFGESANPEGEMYNMIGVYKKKPTS